MTHWDGDVVTATRRLTLRTFRKDDLPLYAALNSDPEVVEFLGGPLSRESSDRIAAYANDLWIAEGIGLLAVERNADATFVGMCGVHVLDSYPVDLEVGWRLAREHWGHGYATEAAAAWLRIAFEDHTAPRVISVTDPPNRRSIAVMDRLGLTFDHEADIEEDGEVFHAVVHAITRERWIEQTRR
ncbi:MAG TPA: GNAT family N-acetyltransferase [Acidimicrobiales bacterium]